MAKPSQPVTLSVEQLTELLKQFSVLRHDVNNTLSLMTAAVELIRYKPQMGEKMMATLLDQPGKITASLDQFSTEFNRALGLPPT